MSLRCGLIVLLLSGEVLAQDAPTKIYRRNFGDSTIERRGRRTPREKSTRYRLLYAPQPASPVAFTTLTYSAPSQEEEANLGNRTLWVKDSDITQTELNFAAEIQPNFDGTPWIFGFRYHTTIKPEETAADYVARIEYPYVQNKHTLTGYGLWINYGFLTLPMTEDLIGLLSAGLDFEYSQLSFYARQSSPDVSYALASVDSSFVVSSLRLQADLDAPVLNHLGPSIGFAMYVPFAKFAAQSKGNVTDPHAKNNPDALTQIQETLDHRITRFAFELRIGVLLY